MCGILASYQPGGLFGQDEILRRATDSMAHRGPDGSGIHIDGPIGLGHRRLSIIDPAGGAQPVHSADGQHSLVYNGEIYNYGEIRAELEGLGHHFRTDSDTEVLLEGLAEWGLVACLERCNGMFAFAWWDRQAKILRVARDRLGIKPLYYWTDGRSFACASELRALFALGVAKRGLEESAIDAYFTLGYVPGEKTLLAGILKLAPGCHLEFGGGELRIGCYWDFAAVEEREVDEGMRETFVELLRDCVARCTVSDVPIGALLSGGLDSSAVVALMHESGIDDISTFTLGYEGPGGENEEVFARAVAARYRCRHFVESLTPGDFFASIERLVACCEEPLVEPAAIALYHVAKLASSQVKVLLSGEGGDEVFAGYGIYPKMLSMERLYGAIPAPLRRIAPMLGTLPIPGRYSKYLDWVGSPLEGRFRGTSASLTPALKARLYERSFFEQRGSYLDEVFGQLFARVPAERGALSRLLYVDAKTWLPHDLLLKADKMTMAASVELRVPFLDHRLVEFAASLPDREKLGPGGGKRILREAMRGRLPVEILTRAKMGFPVPTRRWFSGSLSGQIEELLMDSPAFPWINRKGLAGWFRRGKGLDAEQARTVMTLLVLDRWRAHHGV
jgi:asparagine synthase (glutamine-hydrolysing)